MNISPITDATPACYGICCPQRRNCARYEAVESSPIDHTIASCGAGGEELPLFVPMKKEPLL